MSCGNICYGFYRIRPATKRSQFHAITLFFNWVRIVMFLEN